MNAALLLIAGLVAQSAGMFFALSFARAPEGRGLSPVLRPYAAWGACNAVAAGCFAAYGGLAA